MFAEEPPDLILLETLTLIRDPGTFETVELLLETGLPVWLSFRRCRHGVCGVYGQHWGPPEGDLFGRAARGFEQMGVGALLINCLPVDHVPGMISWLRDFTDLPLGVYPNLGHLAGSRWRFDEQIDPAAYAQLALAWREEGAQIIGGCCGVTPEHIAALAAAVADTKPGRKRPPLDERLFGREPEAPPAEPWRDEQGRAVFPLPFPKLTVDEGVFVPTTGSYLVWKTLFESGVGKDQACLDVGCGCGILSVQLALNGAARVHAIDIDEAAVGNTLANGFRNGVADRLTGEAIDLYHWQPTERFDLIVASLYQMPVDPYEEATWAPAARLLGSEPARPLRPAAAAPPCRRWDRLRDAAVHRRAGPDRPPARRGWADREGRGFQLLPVRPALPAERDADQPRRAALRRLPSAFRRRGRDGRLPARGDPPLTVMRTT